MMLKTIWLHAVLILVIIPSVIEADPLNLHLSTIVRQTYNDNVFLTASKGQDDYVTRVTPGAQVRWLNGLADIRLGAYVTSFFYHENDELNTTDQSYDGVVSYSWSPRFTTHMQVAYINDDRRDRELNQSGLLFGEDVRRRWDIGLNNKWLIDDITSLSMDLSASTEQYDDPESMDLDSIGVLLNVSRDLQSWINRARGQITMGVYQYIYEREYGFSSSAFGDTLSTELKEERSIGYYTFSTGLSYQWTQLLNLNGYVGARYSDTEHENVQTRRSTLFGSDEQSVCLSNHSWGFVGQLRLDYSGSYLRGVLSANHDYTPASGRDGVVERTILLGDISRRFSRELDFGIQAKWFQNKSAAGETGSAIDEATTQLSLAMTYVFNRQWSVGLRYALTRVDDYDDRTHYDRNTTVLTIRWNWALVE
jgi:hypothetical protein